MAKGLLRSAIAQYARTPGKINTKDVVSKIESGYLADSKNGFKQKKTFSPSTLVYNHGECPRYWYLAFEGAEFVDEVTPYQMANMRSGSLSHERIQKAMQDAGIVLSTEKKMICNDPPIFGYMDVEMLWDNAPVPVEIKTTNDMSFSARKERRNALNYHIAQILIYMKIDDREMGLILYENKNTHELLVIPVERNEHYDAWVDQLFEWCREVKAAHEAKTLPKKNYRSNSKICKNCPLQATCNEAGTGEVAIRSLEQLS